MIISEKMINMREIKFRLWNNHAEEMAYNDFWINGSKMVYDDGKSYNDMELDNDLIVMQFTGLKDRNGKEIYEGDILRHKPENKWEEANYCCYEVFLHDGDANSDYNIGYNMCRTHFHGAVCGTRHVPSFKPKNTAKMIVIGNIYENPELIKP